MVCWRRKRSRCPNVYLESMNVLLSVAGQTRLAFGCAAPTGVVLPAAPVQPCLCTGTEATGSVFRSFLELSPRPPRQYPAISSMSTLPAARPMPNPTTLPHTTTPNNVATTLQNGFSPVKGHGFGCDTYLDTPDYGVENPQEDAFQQTIQR